jgi:hypothetical protein
MTSEVIDGTPSTPDHRRSQPYQEPMMSTFRSLPSLRNLLLVDALTCGAMGVFLTLGAGPVGGLTQIPSSLLFYAGLSLFPVAIFMAAVASRPVHPAAAWLIIAGNGLWVVGSFALLLGGWIAPNVLGAGFIVAQALVVVVLAMLEHAALRGTLVAQRVG